MSLSVLTLSLMSTAVSGRHTANYKTVPGACKPSEPRSRNAKSSVPVYMALTETGESVYEGRLPIPRQSTWTG